MSMYTRAMLNAWLKDIILVNHPGTKELASDGGIVLLTSPDAALSSEYLYIGTSDIVTHILRNMSRNRPQPPVRKQLRQPVSASFLPVPAVFSQTSAFLNISH